MITLYDTHASGLARRDGLVAPEAGTVLIDLLNPTREEETHIESALGILLPTREEMKEIEASSRLYQEDGAQFMTATLLTQIDDPWPVTTHITFVLVKGKLVTIRYSEPYAFHMFAKRAMANQVDSGSASAVLIGLLEQIIDRLADFIERMQGDIDKLSQTVFGTEKDKRDNGARYDLALKTVGRQGDLTTRARESLLSLNRLLTYFTYACDHGPEDKAVTPRIKTASRDVGSLSDHLNYLNGQITLLLDATLGLINIDQNRIIKIFSIVSVIFMPPTLVASIYGMNFHAMPELSWSFGYPMAIMVMVLSAIGPLMLFRYKGWL
jgi:magnesium transporter